jgi:hypothetical protein
MTTMSPVLRVGTRHWRTPAFAGAGSGQEDRAVHRVIDDKRRDDRLAAQGGDKGGDLPMAMRHKADQPRAAPGAAAGADHVGAGAGLVEEHQVRRIKRGLLVPPALARLGDVGALLLAGVQNFF